MFFFMEDRPCWWEHMETLGIQAVIDNLKGKGLPARWPTQVPDPDAFGTVFLPFGKGFSCYRSSCPSYEGYYLHGGISAVKCKTCPELLPGIVVDTMCRKDFTACPYFQRLEENNGKHQRECRQHPARKAVSIWVSVPDHRLHGVRKAVYGERK